MSSSTVRATEASPDPSAPVIGRVVLVDPRDERRAITTGQIARCPSLTVVGSSGSLDDADAQIRAGVADVAVIEIQMPITKGLAMIGALRERFPLLRIVVSSFHADAATRAAASVQGADGYLPKPLDTRDLVALISTDRSQGLAAAP